MSPAKRKRILVCTVGIDVDRAVRVITLSVNRLNPDKVVLVHTRQSHEKSHDEVMKSLAEFGLNVEMRFISDPENFDLVFDECLGILSEIVRQNSPNAEIYINYTLAMKPVVIGLCLAAILQNCANFVYISGKRDEETGKTIVGHEKILMHEVGRIREEITLREAIALAKNQDYGGALNLLDMHIKTMVNPSEKLLMAKRTLHFLSLWDKFEHAQALELLKKKEKFSDAVEERRGTYVNAMKKLKDEKDNSKLRFGRWHIVDLCLNAERRMVEGKYDDATARVYRMIEMVVQLLLWEKYGISTSDVDTEMEIYPPKLKEKLRRWKGDDEVLRIGVSRALEVLSEIEGRQIIDVDVLKKYLNIRNFSVLAHGVNPISRNEAIEFLDFAKVHIVPLVLSEQDFEDIRRSLEFPDFAKGL
ncbi:MAG: TIGR02710 family CRISPR-associated protein [Methanomassiliicoccales archaeon]|nr:TIGR02710 family CRISPR-associated protein [Methanomassiliicoccales archaeon]